MTPDQINKQHGKPSWKCWACKSETNLGWWNGLSVAVCFSKPECSKAVGEFFKEEQEKEDAYQEYVREYWGE